MTVQRQRIGRAAEDLVAARLVTANWEIVERNARTRFGELDIIALDGRTLVFVEVKAGVRAPPSAPSARSSASTAASNSVCAALPLPGWASGATLPTTPRSASTLSVSPSTAATARSKSSTSAPPSSRPAPTANTRPTGTSAGAAARCRSARSPRDARVSSIRRARRSPSRGGPERRRACSDRG